MEQKHPPSSKYSQQHITDIKCMEWHKEVPNWLMDHWLTFIAAYHRPHPLHCNRLLTIAENKDGEPPSPGIK